VFSVDGASGTGFFRDKNAKRLEAEKRGAEQGGNDASLEVRGGS